MGGSIGEINVVYWVVRKVGYEAFIVMLSKIKYEKYVGMR